MNRKVICFKDLGDIKGQLAKYSELKNLKSFVHGNIFEYIFQISIPKNSRPDPSTFKYKISEIPANLLLTSYTVLFSEKYKEKFYNLQWISEAIIEHGGDDDWCNCVIEILTKNFRYNRFSEYIENDYTFEGSLIYLLANIRPSGSMYNINDYFDYDRAWATFFTVFEEEIKTSSYSTLIEKALNFHMIDLLNDGVFGPYAVLSMFRLNLFGRSPPLPPHIPINGKHPGLCNNENMDFILEYLIILGIRLFIAAYLPAYHIVFKKAGLSRPSKPSVDYKEILKMIEWRYKSGSNVDVESAIFFGDFLFSLVDSFGENGETEGDDSIELMIDSICDNLSDKIDENISNAIKYANGDDTMADKLMKSARDARPYQKWFDELFDELHSENSEVSKEDKRRYLEIYGFKFPGPAPLTVAEVCPEFVYDGDNSIEKHPFEEPVHMIEEETESKAKIATWIETSVPKKERSDQSSVALPFAIERKSQDKPVVIQAKKQDNGPIVIQTQKHDSPVVIQAKKQSNPVVFQTQSQKPTIIQTQKPNANAPIVIQSQKPACPVVVQSQKPSGPIVIKSQKPTAGPVIVQTQTPSAPVVIQSQKPPGGIQIDKQKPKGPSIVISGKNAPSLQISKK